jgi:hypothetical protein
MKRIVSNKVIACSMYEIPSGLIVHLLSDLADNS